MSDVEDRQNPPEPQLGDLLREAREERGLDLSDVAGLTNVRKEYLVALEEGRYADLPEDVYTRNFLRLFAQAVGFDVVRAQEMYRSEKREARGLDVNEQRLERDRELAADVRPVGDGSRWWETPASGSRWAPLVSTVLMVVAVVALALWGFNSTFFNTSRADPAEEAPAPSEAAAPREEAGQASPEEAPQTGIPRTIRLSVSSNPPGAEVLVDEFPLPGTTPIESAPVTARPSRTIRVELEGYVPAEQEFDLTFDRNLSFALTPQSAAVDAQQAESGQSPDAVGGQGQGNEQGGEQGGEAAQQGDEPQATLTITEDTWLEVYRGTSRNQGERLAFMTARAGQTLSYPLPVYIHVGNAGGVDLEVDGQSRGPLGSSGEVRGLAVTR